MYVAVTKVDHYAERMGATHATGADYQELIDDREDYGDDPVVLSLCGRWIEANSIDEEFNPDYLGNCESCSKKAR